MGIYEYYEWGWENLRNLVGASDAGAAVSFVLSYWYNSFRLRRRYEAYDAPLDPFKMLFVSPDDVRRFTGRRYPPWENFRTIFGSVKSGDWDVRAPPGPDDDYHTPPYLYLGERFSESIVHRSLENHFVNDVPWDETRIVREALELIDGPGLVWNCRCEREIWEKCDHLDSLYNEVKRDGRLYISKIEADTPLSILNRVRNHILVDIGRDGELLFVDGRHRLSIAKILGIDEVPVAVCVRHEQWMDRRDRLYRTGGQTTHPDCPEWHIDQISHRPRPRL